MLLHSVIMKIMMAPALYYTVTHWIIMAWSL